MAGEYTTGYSFAVVEHAGHFGRSPLHYLAWSTSPATGISKEYEDAFYNGDNQEDTLGGLITYGSLDNEHCEAQVLHMIAHEQIIIIL